MLVIQKNPLLSMIIIILYNNYTEIAFCWHRTKQTTLQLSGLGSFLQAPSKSLGSSKLKPFSFLKLADFSTCKTFNDRNIMISALQEINFFLIMGMNSYLLNFSTLLSCDSPLYFSNTSTITFSSN